jgi:hypothetical protein
MYTVTSAFGKADQSLGARRRSSMRSGVLLSEVIREHLGDEGHGRARTRKSTG